MLPSALPKTLLTALITLLTTLASRKVDPSEMLIMLFTPFASRKVDTELPEIAEDAPPSDECRPDRLSVREREATSARV